MFFIEASLRLAALVCSNSLKSLELSTAHGLLKEEMVRLGSLIVDAAHHARVPAGGALAVDRDRFAKAVTHRLEGDPRITIVREEVREIPPDGNRTEGVYLTEIAARAPTLAVTVPNLSKATWDYDTDWKNATTVPIAFAFDGGAIRRRGATV